jgi:hypothetical protein
MVRAIILKSYHHSCRSSSFPPKGLALRHWDSSRFFLLVIILTFLFKFFALCLSSSFQYANPFFHIYCLTIPIFLFSYLCVELQIHVFNIHQKEMINCILFIVELLEATFPYWLIFMSITTIITCTSYMTNYNKIGFNIILV